MNPYQQSQGVQQPAFPQIQSVPQVSTASRLAGRSNWTPAIAAALICFAGFVFIVSSLLLDEIRYARAKSLISGQFADVMRLIEATKK